MSDLLSVVRPLLIKHEGIRFEVYHDTKGIPTIGIGFNLNRPDARQRCEDCGADYDALLSGQASLTPAQCDCLFEHCVIDAVEFLAKEFPDFRQYSIPRQAALVDLMFNLGPGGFSEFRHMIIAIKVGDWQDAVTELLSSELDKQLPERTADNASLMLKETA